MDRLLSSVVILVTVIGACIVALNIWAPNNASAAVTSLLTVVGPALLVFINLLQGQRTERKVDHVRYETEKTAVKVEEAKVQVQRTEQKVEEAKVKVEEAKVETHAKVEEIRGAVNGREQLELQKRIANLEQQLKEHRKKMESGS